MSTGGTSQSKYQEFSNGESCLKNADDFNIIIDEKSSNGVVVSGVVAWFEMQIHSHNRTFVKNLAEKHFSNSEITKAKETMQCAISDAAKNVLIQKKRDIFAARKGENKKKSEIEDLVLILETLEECDGLPLIVATTSQMKYCPLGWGTVSDKDPDAANIGVKAMVQTMEKNMESVLAHQTETIAKLQRDISSLVNSNKKTVIGARRGSTSQSVDIPESPNKRMRPDEENLAKSLGHQSVINATKPTFSDVASKPGTPRNNSGNKTPRKPRSILIGDAKSDNSTQLSANVSLVASGLSTSCTEDSLKSFLNGNGLHPIAIKLLTRPEIVEEVRSLSFKVTFKASDLEMSLKSELLPYRVSVRYFRNYRPKRQENNESGNGRGRMNFVNGISQLSNSGIPHSKNMFSTLGDNVPA